MCMPQLCYKNITQLLNVRAEILTESVFKRSNCVNRNNFKIFQVVQRVPWQSPSRGSDRHTPSLCWFIVVYSTEDLIATFLFWLLLGLSWPQSLNFTFQLLRIASTILIRMPTDIYITLCFLKWQFLMLLLQWYCSRGIQHIAIFLALLL